MLEFVGEEFDERCLTFHENRRYARTASYAQVTEPLYDRSRYRYRHYRKHLDAGHPDPGAGDRAPGLPHRGAPRRRAGGSPIAAGAPRRRPRSSILPLAGGPPAPGSVLLPVGEGVAGGLGAAPALPRAAPAPPGRCRRTCRRRGPRHPRPGPAAPSTRTSIVAPFGFSVRSVSQIGWARGLPSRAEPCGRKLASS